MIHTHTHTTYICQVLINLFTQSALPGHKAMLRLALNGLYLCARIFSFGKRSVEVISIDNVGMSLTINGLMMNKGETDTWKGLENVVTM